MLIASLILQAALAMEPIQQKLTVPYDLWDVTAADLNQDDQMDIVALYAERDGATDRKGVYVFLAQPDGYYPETPTLTLPLTEDSGCAFVTQYDGQSQLAVFTEKGLTRYRMLDQALVEAGTVEVSTIFPLYTREPIFLRNVSFDIDGDDYDEWILPTVGGHAIWGNGQHHYATLRAPIDGNANNSEGLRVSYPIPEVRVFEYGDSNEPAIGLVGTRSVSFHFGEGWKEKREHLFADPDAGNWNTAATLDDINGDGYPDLMLTETKGTADIEVRIRAFLANADLSFPDSPILEIDSKGGILSPLLTDVDGDGRLDVAVRGFPINLKNIANYLLRKKITMRLDSYLFDGTKLPEDPSFHNSITFDISQSQEDSILEYGDFDGDGANELAVCTGENSLTVSEAAQSGSVTKQPIASLTVRAFGNAEVVDLDNSGTDDLLIYHPRGSHRQQISVIRF